MNTNRLTLSLAAIQLCTLTLPAQAENLIDSLTHAWQARTQTAPTTSQLEVGFSPEGSALALVLKAINASQTSVRVLAYSFTSWPIAQALIAAHKRGVDVQVVVDKSQKSEKYTSAAFLANNGIPVRVDSMHAIAHNKVLIIDQKHIETGSFNFTAAASSKNAENALVAWNNPVLAKIYLENWQTHWQHAEEYRARY